MLSRKYYEMIAKAIKDNSYDINGRMECQVKHEVVHKDDLIDDLLIEFKKDNKLFNRAIFVEKCSD